MSLKPTESPTIPFHRPFHRRRGDRTEVVSTLRSGWLTTGARAAQFEREFAAYTEGPYAVAG